MVEDPAAALGQLGLDEGGVVVLVHVKANDAWFPFDGVEMKVIGIAPSGGKREPFGGIRCWLDEAWRVEGAVDGSRFAAYVFHDVDFAAVGPVHAIDVVSHHPEGGPNSLPAWNFYAGFKSAVSLREEALRLEAR